MRHTAGRAYSRQQDLLTWLVNANVEDCCKPMVLQGPVWALVLTSSPRVTCATAAATQHSQSRCGLGPALGEGLCPGFLAPGGGGGSGASVGTCVQLLASCDLQCCIPDAEPAQSLCGLSPLAWCCVSGHVPTRPARCVYVCSLVSWPCVGRGGVWLHAQHLQHCTCLLLLLLLQEVDLAITADLGTLQRLPAIVGHGKSVIYFSHPLTTVHVMAVFRC
jgi:hypothetical protein